MLVLLGSAPPFQEIFAIDYLNPRISIENGKAFVNPLICLFLSYSRYSNVLFSILFLQTVSILVLNFSF